RPIARAASDEVQARVEPGAWRVRLAPLPAAERRTALLDLVRGEVAAVLGYADADELAPGRNFTELGFDSLTGVMLRNRLAMFTALRLPATVAFDLPSAERLTEHLLGQLAAVLPEAVLPEAVLPE